LKFCCFYLFILVLIYIVTAWSSHPTPFRSLALPYGLCRCALVPVVTLRVGCPASIGALARRLPHLLSCPARSFPSLRRRPDSPHRGCARSPRWTPRAVLVYPRNVLLLGVDKHVPRGLRLVWRC